MESDLHELLHTPAKEGVLYELEFDPDWGTRFPRDRKFFIHFIKTGGGKLDIKLILKRLKDKRHPKVDEAIRLFESGCRYEISKLEVEVIQ